MRELDNELFGDLENKIQAEKQTRYTVTLLLYVCLQITS